MEGMDLDQKILARLAQGPDQSRGLLLELELKDVTEGGKTTPAGRILDKALQRLRRAGKIKFEKQHWHLVGPS